MWPTLVSFLAPQIFMAHLVLLLVFVGISPLDSSESCSSLAKRKRVISLLELAVAVDGRGSLWNDWGRGSTLIPRVASQPVHSHIPTQNGENEQAWVSIQRTVLLTSDKCKRVAYLRFQGCAVSQSGTFLCQPIMCVAP